jgi:hypothetical protein
MSIICYECSDRIDDEDDLCDQCAPIDVCKSCCPFGNCSACGGHDEGMADGAGICADCAVGTPCNECNTPMDVESGSLHCWNCNE